MPQFQLNSESQQASNDGSENNMPAVVNKKIKKDHRNRSSEFSKEDLRMIDPSILHRNSNDLAKYKGNSILKDNRRMYSLGMGLSTSTGSKFKQGEI